MRVLALYNIKGGVGKTSSAVNLAWLFASAGRRTLLWDLDPQGAATFTFRIKPKVKGGGQRLLEQPAALEEAIRGSDFPGLDLVPADFSYRKLDRSLERGEDPHGQLESALSELSDSYDRVVLDCPASISLLIENVFTASDVLLVPTIPTVLSLRTLARLMKHLKSTRGKERPVVLPFFSMVDRRKRLHRDVCTYVVEQGLRFLTSEIPYASVVEQMGVRRSPLGAYAKGSAPAKAYVALAEEVEQHLERAHLVPRSPGGKAVRSLLDAARSH